MLPVITSEPGDGDEIQQKRVIKSYGCCPCLHSVVYIDNGESLGNHEVELQRINDTQASASGELPTATLAPEVTHPNILQSKNPNSCAPHWMTLEEDDEDGVSETSILSDTTSDLTQCMTSQNMSMSCARPPLHEPELLVEAAHMEEPQHRMGAIHRIVYSTDGKILKPASAVSCYYLAHFEESFIPLSRLETVDVIEIADELLALIGEDTPFAFFQDQHAKHPNSKKNLLGHSGYDYLEMKDYDAVYKRLGTNVKNFLKNKTSYSLEGEVSFVLNPLHKVIAVKFRLRIPDSISDTSSMTA